MDPHAWLLDPKIRQSIHEDDVCRHVIDAVHEAMMSRGVTARDLARHLGVKEKTIHAGIVDPLSLRVSDLLRVLDTLQITLAPMPRAA